MFLIRFWRNLTKKDSVESAKYELIFLLLVLTVFGRFLHGSGFSGFLADPDSWNKFDPDPKHWWERPLAILQRIVEIQNHLAVQCTGTGPKQHLIWWKATISRDKKENFTCCKIDWKLLSSLCPSFLYNTFYLSSSTPWGGSTRLLSQRVGQLEHLQLLLFLLV